jgi:hypothetical protein
VDDKLGVVEREEEPILSQSIMLIIVVRLMTIQCSDDPSENQDMEVAQNGAVLQV